MPCYVHKCKKNVNICQDLIGLVSKINSEKLCLPAARNKRNSGGRRSFTRRNEISSVAERWLWAQWRECIDYSAAGADCWLLTLAEQQVWYAFDVNDLSLDQCSLTDSVTRTHTRRRALVKATVEATDRRVYSVKVFYFWPMTQTFAQRTRRRPLDRVQTHAGHSIAFNWNVLHFVTLWP